ncbi:MAG: TatD family hydrolase [Kiritimatiellae bacterium]|jgi:predicted metal-dependent TIM-barrel fold hydrolase|nr:TatD family hydrolase [Kiritimatiellia bacterium]MDD4342737.1 TatD family hydrolase [Kiritimatiellia bacterium]MDY0150473.1 TatD family hydrolase [Kiritimatiellia bacterium]
MIIIEPHIHMISRTTDDYTAMYNAGIRCVVEPSFWQGVSRRHAGTFYDYFALSLDFEHTRSLRYGIDHYSCISVNPKEADDLALAMETLDGMAPYLDHPRCVCVGEIGFNRITPNEEKIFQRQLEMAKAHALPVLVHTPHDTPETSKKDGVARILAILREFNYDPSKIVVDHNTEETMPLTRKTDYWAGLTVYPYSKLNPRRVVDILRRWGVERVTVNSSADWGVSDPCSLPKTAAFMAEEGFDEPHIQQIMYDNPLAFYSQTPKFTPQLDLPYIDPATYQR